ncbi:MAG: hypothetical protein A2X22_13495 [Bacteroidetes bacterium GWF2_49_14]|nr:MAG: hypothetical protein A2X22_13495 [Bacteroidetes bacterium GWF2_49_14]HBB93333.1 hypothetical protein [Bacteroidales bacterium]
MATEKYIWEKDGFRKDPYRIPQGYFESLGDRIISRIDPGTEAPLTVRPTLIRPWMTWVSGIAAVFVLGWFGLREFYLKPHQELQIQESLSHFTDYYGEELNEGLLAGFVADYEVEVSFLTQIDYQDLINAEPESTEELIYESIIF